MKHIGLAFAAGALIALAAPTLAFAQDSVADQLIDAACADDGALVRRLAGIFGTTAAATLLANFRGKLPASSVV
jgi:hypothetical protein